MNLASLNTLTIPGNLFRPTDKPQFIQCVACAHRCKIKEGTSGICRIRYNEKSTLRVPFGYVAAWQCDPIEKKPFFHAYPGSLAMSFGMLGCDFHCGYCQNWITSQALRDPMAGAEARKVTPQAFVQEALRFKARIVTSTYNEPLITSEWAMAIFKEARKHGLGTSYVSNGNATNEVLDYIQPFTDLYKIDLKTFQDRNYRQLGGTLEAVLDTVKGVYKRGIWLEIVTLVVPTFNDSDDELRQIAEFLVDVSPNIPWHVTAFHKDYKMTDPVNTPPTTLVRAADIGKEAGLNFVYAGNTPGMVESYEDTVCPNCNTTLIRRWGFSIREYSLTEDKKCPECMQSIPGIWERPSKREYDYPIVVS